MIYNDFTALLHFFYIWFAPDWRGRGYLCGASLGAIASFNLTLMSKYFSLLLLSFLGLSAGHIPATRGLISASAEVTTRVANPEAHTTTAYRHFIDKGLADRSGACWFMGTEGVYRYADGQFALYRSIGGMYMGYGGSILEDRTGNVWFGALGGVVCYDLAASRQAARPLFASYKIDGPSGAQLLTSLQELREAPGSPAMVRTMAQDSRGHIWFGTGHELYRTDSASGTALTTGIGAVLRADRLRYTCTHPDDYGIYALYPDSAGNLLISMNACSCGPPATYLLLADRMDHPCVLGRCGHDLLQGDQYQAHTHALTASLRLVTTRDGQNRIAFATALRDKTGKVWIGSDSGVYTYEAGYFIPQRLNDTLDRSRITAMSEDATGAIWFGTGEDIHFRGNGVFRYQPAGAGKAASVTHYTVAGGMPVQTPFRNDIITSLLEDGSGRMWMAGQGGICYSAGGSLSALATRENELPVYFVMKDRSGGIWFSTWELGLYRYSAGKLERLSEK